MKITKMLANKKIAALVSVTTTVAIAGGAIALASNANEEVTLETEPVVIEEVAEEAADDSVIVATEDMVEEQTYDTSSEETQAVTEEESEETEASEIDEAEESEETTETEETEESEDEEDEDAIEYDAEGYWVGEYWIPSVVLNEENDEFYAYSEDGEIIGVGSMGGLYGYSPSIWQISAFEQTVDADTFAALYESIRVV